MSRLARNVSANLLSNAWATGLSLVLTPVYLGFLGVESFGVIGFYVSLTALAGILDTGISATAVREIAWLSARPGERAAVPSLLRSLEAAYWAIVLPIGAVLLIAVWWFGAGWFRSASIPADAIRTAMMLMVMALVVQIPSGLYSAALIGLQQQVRCARLVTVFGTARGAGAAAVVALIAPDVRAFFVWQLCVSVLQTLITRRSAWNAIGHGLQPARVSSTLLHSVKQFAGGMTLLTALSLILTQADKMIVSRLISLEAFGLYMLAWTVASGLSRLVTPLMQAFGPHLTELVSRGDDRSLGTQVRIASQLTSALILPPAALLVLRPEAILFAWTGNATVAAGAAPLLAVLTVGTLLAACSYPPLTVLYAKARLGPVLALNVAAVVVLVPLVVAAATRFGPMGAAWCWGLFGLVTYVGYLTLGLQGLRGTGPVDSMLRDFVVPGLASLSVAVGTWYWSSQADGRLEIAALLGIGLMVGWAAALVACRDLFRIAMNTFRSDSIGTP